MSEGNLCITFREGDAVDLMVNGVKCRVTIRRIGEKNVKILLQAPKDMMRIERDMAGTRAMSHHTMCGWAQCPGDCWERYA